jgi:hypothetical protein
MFTCSDGLTASIGNEIKAVCHGNPQNASIPTKNKETVKGISLIKIQKA